MRSFLTVTCLVLFCSTAMAQEVLTISELDRLATKNAADISVLQSKVQDLEKKVDECVSCTCDPATRALGSSLTSVGTVVSDTPVSSRVVSVGQPYVTSVGPVRTTYSSLGSYFPVSSGTCNNPNCTNPNCPNRVNMSYSNVSASPVRYTTTSSRPVRKVRCRNGVCTIVR